MPLRPLAVVIVFATSACLGAAQSNPKATAIDTYLHPYVQSGNFAGEVLVEKSGRVIFEKAYGFAGREDRVRNTAATQFHIASMSMQFTAAAVLRLVDAGSISLDEHVGEFVRGIDGADKITIRDLLTERSGLPDINALPDYDDVLQHHQTPDSLIAKIEGRPLLFEPGSKFLHEEHSAYNLLAYIVEKKSGLPFAAALERLVFRPMGLTASGVDDDSMAHDIRMAQGYEPEGTYGLKPARAIHWSAKTGNASVYTTAGNEARWVEGLFSGHALSASSREAVIDTSMRVGYGWFKGESKRFGGAAFYMNGRAPGFASFVLYLPGVQTTVVVLCNIYSSATTTIGNDIAALTLGLPYEPFHLRNPAPSPMELKTCTGTFQFGPDFYQANAKVALAANGQELSMRWPSGDVSALIPFGKDRFVDRSYWEEVEIERDSSGRPTALVYDRFHGAAISPQ
ncbi:MAG TPA: serine hydrolase domain-containing protein [Terracidiphilus sp.]|jgi:CubicO group peptidase (beta-lactamase class C family)|nr:serine hydrolase domain-containing protein [Terracidiphilus sp.]